MTRQASQPHPKRAAKPVKPIDELPDGMHPILTVLEYVPVCRTTFLKYVRGGTYPQPVPLTARKMLWRASDIRALMTAGPRKRPIAAS